MNYLDLHYARNSNDNGKLDAIVCVVSKFDQRERGPGHVIRSTDHWVIYRQILFTPDLVSAVK